MVVGIRVDAQNIQTGKVKHCNSSYFTMIAKDEQGNNIKVPRLILTSKEDVLRYMKTIERLKLRHSYAELCTDFNGDIQQAINNITKNGDVKVQLS